MQVEPPSPRAPFIVPNTHLQGITLLRKNTPWIVDDEEPDGLVGQAGLEADPTRYVMVCVRSKDGKRKYRLYAAKVAALDALGITPACKYWDYDEDGSILDTDKMVSLVDLCALCARMHREAAPFDVLRIDLSAPARLFLEVLMSPEVQKLVESTGHVMKPVYIRCYNGAYNLGATGPILKKLLASGSVQMEICDRFLMCRGDGKLDGMFREHCAERIFAPCAAPCEEICPTFFHTFRELVLALNTGGLAPSKIKLQGKDPRTDGLPASLSDKAKQLWTDFETSCSDSDFNAYLEQVKLELKEAPLSTRSRSMLDSVESNIPPADFFMPIAALASRPKFRNLFDHNYGVANIHEIETTTKDATGKVVTKREWRCNVLPAKDGQKPNAGYVSFKQSIPNETVFAFVADATRDMMLRLFQAAADAAQ